MAKTSTSIKPGEVRNPHGRPKSDRVKLTPSMRDLMCKKTNDLLPEMLEKLGEMALSGQMPAISFLIEHGVGRSYTQREPQWEDEVEALNVFANKLAKRILEAKDIPIKAARAFVQIIDKIIEEEKQEKEADQLKQASHESS